MSEPCSQKADIQRNHEDIKEVKQTLVRHKDEMLQSMRTYVGAMKDLMIDQNERHEKDIDELKTSQKETNNKLDDVIVNVTKVVGILTGIGIAANVVIGKFL